MPEFNWQNDDDDFEIDDDDFDDDDFDDEDDDVWDESDPDLTHCTICPNCNLQIYDDTPMCPYCNEALAAPGTNFLEGKPTWYIVLALLGIGAVILALLSFP